MLDSVDMASQSEIPAVDMQYFTIRMGDLVRKKSRILFSLVGKLTIWVSPKVSVKSRNVLFSSNG